VRLDEPASQARGLRAARLAVGCLATALLLGGCRSEGAETVSIRWAEKPKQYAPGALPRDRIAQGEVVATGGELELRAEDLRVLDGAGRELESSVAFISGYAPSIEPLNQLSDLPEDEERRIGRLATIGAEPVPLTVSWRLPRGADPAVKIDYGEGALPLPAG
jgi:hypothetical protein